MKTVELYGKQVILAVFFLFTFFLYLHNIAHDIFGGDNGDLVTAAYVFGVAHPPGYPLLMLFGYIISHISLPLPVAARVSLISIVSSLIALIFFYHLIRKETNSFLIAIISSSTLAFSYLFW